MVGNPRSLDSHALAYSSPTKLAGAEHACVFRLNLTGGELGARSASGEPMLISFGLRAHASALHQNW